MMNQFHDYGASRLTAVTAKKSIGPGPVGLPQYCWLLLALVALV